MPTVKIHYLPTGPSLPIQMLCALRRAIAAEQAEGFQVWVGTRAGPVLVPPMYELVGLDGPQVVFRTPSGRIVRRTGLPATPPRRAAA